MVERAGGLKKTVHYTLLSIILATMAFPLIWMFRVAFAPVGTETGLFSTLIGGFTFSNFLDLFTADRMGRYLFNSVFVGLAVTLGNLLFSFMAGYALARYRSLANRLLFISVLVVLMIPVHITIIPMYILMLKLKLYDSYWALILPFLVNPIGIFLIKQYVESIPTSMEEAARIDGAGDWRILFTVVMPVCKPALAVLAIQVFFTNWNSFLFPFILTSSESLRTLPVALAMLQGHQAIDWPHLMAGSAIAVIPVLILFMILQRQIVSGITAGAIKQ
ncbi:MAG TPA: carbohydrate ABC transporter permease [candidate division Zixibacteria bacterium]|nr:carbohydrate ABC transporter permease [candidate division Zixibacteria bacterium]